MTVTFRSFDSPTELDESVLGPASAKPGDITVRGRAFSADDTEGIASGTRESEPGISRWEFLTRGEVITVVSGRMSVARDGDGPVVHTGHGDSTTIGKEATRLAEEVTP